MRPLFDSVRARHGRQVALPLRYRKWQAIVLIGLAISLTSLPLSIRASRPRVSSQGSSSPYRAAPPLPEADGVIAAKLGPLVEDIVARGIADGRLPGCVLVVGSHDKLLFHQAYGARALLPERIAMTEDTIFDLASLTKPLATATSIMKLSEQSALELDQPVATYVPEFGQHGKEKISVRQLMTHVSGLPADTPLEDFDQGRAEALRRIYALTPKQEPGTKFIYSDVGFLVLEEVVRRVSKSPFEVFTRKNIWDSLGMKETGFLPPPALRERSAFTEQRHGAFMVGEVHDPRAYRIGGVAGHAGLFSSAHDVSRYAQAMLNGGALGNARVLEDETVQQMFARHDLPLAIRALGWDNRSAYATQRGDTLSRRAVGHGGYTGTSLWIDPALDLFILFLSNRVHPDGKGAINPLVGEITQTVVRTLVDAGAVRNHVLLLETAASDTTPRPSVELGIDVLRGDGFALLAGANVGLVTNASGVATDGSRTIDLLQRAPNVHLRALFAPEHGLGANRDERIADSVDASSGLPVHSLYGASFEPSPEALRGIDTLVIDLQDVGARFYTYASTMHRVLEVAARRALRVVVLDRPNPLGGIEVAGPVVVGPFSFVNHARLPIRHGMTIGELAYLLDAEQHLALRLDVVPMRHWNRASRWEDTGLAWVPPSPNLTHTRALALYPGVALVEGTNVSVGRGTKTPFEWVGAPYIDGDRLAARLESASLGGIQFTPTRFTPSSGPYAHQSCGGVALRITDAAVFEPVRVGIALALELRRAYPEAWNAERLNDIVASPLVTRAILDLRPLREIEEIWRADLAAFRAKREKYLLYR